MFVAYDLFAVQGKDLAGLVPLLPALHDLFEEVAQEWSQEEAREALGEAQR